MLSVTGSKKIRIMEGRGKENLYKTNALLIEFGDKRKKKKNEGRRRTTISKFSIKENEERKYRKQENGDEKEAEKRTVKEE